jgi:hypothetical protein
VDPINVVSAGSFDPTNVVSTCSVDPTNVVSLSIVVILCKQITWNLLLYF